MSALKSTKQRIAGLHAPRIRSIRFCETVSRLQRMFRALDKGNEVVWHQSLAKSASIRLVLKAAEVPQDAASSRRRIQSRDGGFRSLCGMRLEHEPALVAFRAHRAKHGGRKHQRFG